MYIYLLVYSVGQSTQFSYAVVDALSIADILWKFATNYNCITQWHTVITVLTPAMIMHGEVRFTNYASTIQSTFLSGPSSPTFSRQ
jgi:hypothetical protein